MKYKLSVVSYVNTIPFIYGLKQYGLDKKLDISLDIPSTCAEKLLSREVDIGLVPIVVLKQLEGSLAEDINLLPPIINCIKNECTLGEICQIMRDIHGEHF